MNNIFPHSAYSAFLYYKENKIIKELLNKNTNGAKIMSIIKSFSVGNGDCFYIKHGTSNFTIIDGYNNDDEKFESIIEEIKEESKNKDIIRFISTHPDEDHFKGIEKLFTEINIPNFYCVENKATKNNPPDDFDFYCSLRDKNKSFYIYKGCRRKWFNENDEEKKYGSSGFDVLWPNKENSHFKEALRIAAEGGNANNISPILKYSLNNGITALWFGDMEKNFLDKIYTKIKWPDHTDVLFAPHHGRDSGKIPENILKQINPSLIIIGEADSTYLNYYKNWNTITQNSAGDIVFECEVGKTHIFVSSSSYEYKCDNLSFDTLKYKKGFNYIGALKTGGIK